MTKVVILAAGKGKRMKADKPKCLHKIKGKAIIERLLEAIKKAKVDKKPVMVVNYREGMIKEKVGSKCLYVHQDKQLGTAHAVLTAKSKIKNADTVMVFPSDHPFLTARTVSKLHDVHKKSGAMITLVSTKVNSFSDINRPFKQFGRIVRNKRGQLQKIIELKDANSVQKKIKEVNTSMYCFDAKWLWQNIKKVGKQNKQGEYYLTDLVGLAVEQREKVGVVRAKAGECLGFNTKEEFELFFTHVRVSVTK